MMLRAKTVGEIPEAELMDGRHHSGTRRVLCGEENECLRRDVGWSSIGRLRPDRLGMEAMRAGALVLIQKIPLDNFLAKRL